MSVASRLRAKLAEALKPARLDIVDESERHKGHAGARPGGETHFRIEIVSDLFRGKPRLERQRMVLAVLADEIGPAVHALSLRTLTPEEDRAG
jgi:BolA protein